MIDEQQESPPVPDGTAVPEQGDTVALPEGEAPINFDEASDEVLRIELDRFEGPFEVLLYLIKSQEIDIFDIPILKVTEQYLRFLELMKEENLDIAGDFLVMAATLIQIKSRMILPIETIEDDEDPIEEEDPRLELVEKLLEYRKYRDLGHQLGDLHDLQQDQYPRLIRVKMEVIDEEDAWEEVSLYDLSKAVRAVMRFIRDPVVRQLAAEAYSVDEKVNALENMLAERQSVTWSELYDESRDKLEVVCFLLAILELCRMHRVRLHQQRTFGEIRLFARDPSDRPPLDDDEAAAHVEYS